MVRSGWILGLFGLWVATAAAQPQVTLTNGQVVAGRLADDVASYLGVPYAQAPVDQLRWQPPQPAKATDAVLQATDFGPACMQPVVQDVAGATFSEDCLSLNVWAPSNAEKAPVMVWIHGGGFRFGSGRIAGERFAREGVVLVSINYRMGPLGFFAHPALGSSVANFGLLDMEAALQWVQRNADRFGGDPDRVTIFGVSAGGMAVSLLMVSARTEGLFHKAIMQSTYSTWPLLRTQTAPAASAPGDAGLNPAATAEQFAEAVAKRAGAADQTAAALRALSAEQLVNALDGFQLPLVDGHSLEEEPWALFERGRVRRIPVLVGGNSYEGAVMPMSGISEEQFRSLVGEHDVALRDAYGADFAHSDQQGYQRAFGDYRYLLAAWHTADAMSALGQSARFYYVDLHQPPMGTPLGTPHGFDARLLWGAATPHPVQGPLGDRMRDAWIRFASDAVGSKDTFWPEWDPAKPMWWVLSEQDRTEAAFLIDKIRVLQAMHLHRVDGG